ncbi:hypothetical protein I551_7075 [Mycobacterium ulcerans str. Harvey]|uniref:Uncharacterized protein n=1 Tax=Mycobacterium ulcerans str. Harvey TaxID=1299332 RepID=A0ABN0QPF8_MYCUL|nr:hypothetical protein I551_7075 [Mycobacterium ulcerans str. Harvey]
MPPEPMDDSGTSTPIDATFRPVARRAVRPGGDAAPVRSGGDSHTDNG